MLALLQIAMLPYVQFNIIPKLQKANFSEITTLPERFHFF
jgi:hypothetical protein